MQTGHIRRYRSIDRKRDLGVQRRIVISRRDIGDQRVRARLIRLVCLETPLTMYVKTGVPYFASALGVEGVLPATQLWMMGASTHSFSTSYMKVLVTLP